MENVVVGWVVICCSEYCYCVGCGVMLGIVEWCFVSGCFLFVVFMCVVFVFMFLFVVLMICKFVNFL